MDAKTGQTSATPTASRFRHSKFRHIYGKAASRERCYDNIRVTTNSGDAQTNLCAVNPLYLAVITDAVGGGSFLVLPLDRFGRVDRDPPLVTGHRAAVLDIQWCPHNDHCIASASEDCTAKVWLISPELFDSGRPVGLRHRDLAGHSRRVSLLAWHPTASMVLLTAGADNRVLLWDVDKQLVMRDFAFPDAVLSCSFSWTGAKFVCACRDRLARLVDARSGKTLAESRLHAGSKPAQLVCLRDGRVFSTGFADASGGRQLGLWSGDNLAPIDLQSVDSGSTGALLPFYDPDVGLIYLAGRGDCAVRYYELTEEAPSLQYLGVYRVAEPLRGVGAMPKRGLQVGACEIGRLYTIGQRGLCQPVSFIVPRRSELFQSDLYPDTRAPASAMGAEAWLAGAEAQPLLMPLTPATTVVETGPAMLAPHCESTNATDIGKSSSPSIIELHRIATTVAELSDRVDRLSDSARLLAAQGADLCSRVAELEALAAASAAGNQHNASDIPVLAQNCQLIEEKKFEDESLSDEDYLTAEI